MHRPAIQFPVVQTKIFTTMLLSNFHSCKCMTASKSQRKAQERESQSSHTRVGNRTRKAVMASVAQRKPPTFKLPGQEVAQPSFQQRSNATHEKQPDSPASSPKATARAFPHRALESQIPSRRQEHKLPIHSEKKTQKAGQTG